MTLYSDAERSANPREMNIPQMAGHEDAKPFNSEKHLEQVGLAHEDLVYNDLEHEPELHFRTWVALISMWLYNYVIVFALLSPPAVVRDFQPELQAVLTPL